MREQPQAPESFGRRVRTRVRRYVFEDARLKLLALLTVTVIWFSVAGQTRTGTPVKIHNLEVTLDNLPQGLAVTNTDRNQVDVTVVGPEDLLRELRFEVATKSADLTAYADLSNLTEGVQLARLLVRGLPDGVTLKQVDPAAVQVTLDPIGEREIPVEPQFAGELPDGYTMTGYSVKPEAVTVTGPESVISRIEKLTTTTVSLNNRLESFSEQADVITGEDVVARTRPFVSVVIEEDYGNRSFTVPIVVDGAAGGQADPQTVTVTLKGPVPALEAIKASDITASIPASGAVTRQGLAPQILISGAAAPLVEVERVQPQTVRVRK